MEKERLHKILAARGVASRRACEEIIAEGRVMVDGAVVTRLGTKVSPDADIRVDGRKLATPGKAYYILNKPRGYITTMSDERGRKSVADLTKRLHRRVYPVGRLDAESEGLILLTNDGEMANVLTHPRHEIDKTYIVRTRAPLEEEAINKLQSGVRLREGRAAGKVKILKRTRASTTLLITINRGYNRQIRRMVVAVGHQVTRLKRVGFGPLRLAGVARGSFRALRREEIDALRKLVADPKPPAAAKGAKTSNGEVRVDRKPRKPGVRRK